ncbi:MAG: hypothetical protein ACUVX9_01675 [Anaerolineae bacterium]
MPSRLRLLALSVAVTLLFGRLPLPVAAESGLRNPGFEEGFSDRNSGGHVIVADGWEYWYQDGPNTDRGLNFRPSYQPGYAAEHGGTRIHGGAKSQKMGNDYAAHNAGLWQRVSVPRGSTVTFSIWAFCWSSNKDNANSAEQPGNYRLSVGIDPTGGTDWRAPTVRWSEPRIEYLKWIQLSISAPAEADAVTVFVRGNPEYPVKHNESCWDDATLSIVAPTPRPTNTPRPTDTPTITPTPEPSATSTATPTPVRSDLCLQAYVDANNNGARDADEQPVPGGVISVLDSQRAEVGRVLTTGYQEPVCIRDLPAGDYVLQIRAPAGYELAVSSELPFVLGDDGDNPPTLAVALRRLAAAPTASPAPSPTALPLPTATPEPPPSLGRSLYNVSGILVALAALGILGALVLSKPRG